MSVPLHVIDQLGFRGSLLRATWWRARSISARVIAEILDPHCFQASVLSHHALRWLLTGSNPVSTLRMRPSPDVHESKAAHTPALMKVPGVVGVAVGESEGTPCIRVFVDAMTDDICARVPPQLDGHPVEVIVTGPFSTS